MQFQIRPELANPPPGLRIAAFKIVSNQIVEHPFPPSVDRVTGLVKVKTLSFSAYVLMQAQIIAGTEARPSLPVVSSNSPVSVNVTAYSREDEDGHKYVFANPNSPMFLGLVLGGSTLLLLCASAYAIRRYMKQYESNTRKAGIFVDETSHRMQESHEPSSEDLLFLGTDLVTTDGSTVSPPSSRTGPDDIERIQMLGDGLEEVEPAEADGSELTHAAAQKVREILGSVGKIGSGTKLPRALLPSEVKSSVMRMGVNDAGELEMTADLVVLETNEMKEEDFEEAEPMMHQARSDKEGIHPPGLASGWRSKWASHSDEAAEDPMSQEQEIGQSHVDLTMRIDCEQDEFEPEIISQVSGHEIAFSHENYEEIEPECVISSDQTQDQL